MPPWNVDTLISYFISLHNFCNFFLALSAQKLCESAGRDFLQLKLKTNFRLNYLFLNIFCRTVIITAKMGRENKKNIYQGLLAVSIVGASCYYTLLKYRRCHSALGSVHSFGIESFNVHSFIVHIGRSQCIYNEKKKKKRKKNDDFFYIRKRAVYRDTAAKRLIAMNATE